MYSYVKRECRETAGLHSSALVAELTRYILKRKKMKYVPHSRPPTNVNETKQKNRRVTRRHVCICIVYNYRTDSLLCFSLSLLVVCSIEIQWQRPGIRNLQLYSERESGYSGRKPAFLLRYGTCRKYNASET